MNMAATFARLVQRKEKKDLNFSLLREAMSNNSDFIKYEKKRRGHIIASEEQNGGQKANRKSSVRSGRQVLDEEDGQLSRTSRNFDAIEKGVTMDNEISVIPYEIEEKKQDMVATTRDGEQSNFNTSGKMEPLLQNGPVEDIEVDSERHCWTTGHFDPSVGYDKLVDEQAAISLESQIDLENHARLEKMSADEIAEAQKEITTKMSPGLISALRKRGHEKLEKQKNPVPDMATNGLSGVEQNKKNLINTPAISDTSRSSQKVIEASSEDLQIDRDKRVIKNLRSKNSSLWDAWTKRVERVREMRFNLDGDIVEPDFAQASDSGKMYAHSGYSADNVSERDFLRTEGDPSAVGYTIKEAVALSRSVVPAQRSLALRLIASILEKANWGICQRQVCNTKFGEADGYIDWEAIWAFALGPEPELALSLRIQSDDNHNSVVLA